MSVPASKAITVLCETLIRKDNVGLLSEELASHYCLQIPGWCPCVNCRDFSPSISLLAKDFAKDNLCDMNRESYSLMLKRKASATASAATIGEVTEAAKQAQARGTPQDTNQPEAQPGERFQFDCHSDNLQTFKEGECPANTAKSNEWALRNFEAWRNARNKKFKDDPCPEDIFLPTRKLLGCVSVCAKQGKAMGRVHPKKSLFTAKWTATICSKVKPHRGDQYLERPSIYTT